MSVISNIHAVVNYDAKKSSAFSGQRLAKITYKVDKETKVKKDNKCVSIPQLDNDSIMNNIHLLMPAIKDMLCDTQDKIIRGLIDAGKTEIADAEISVLSCISYLDAESSGARLTKEAIGSWFDSSLADMLTVAFADKLGVSDTPTFEEQSKVDFAVASYKDKFSGLAGGKTSYSPELAERLIKALEFASPEDELASKFKNRLEKMKVKQEADLLAL